MDTTTAQRTRSVGLRRFVWHLAAATAAILCAMGLTGLRVDAKERQEAGARGLRNGDDVVDRLQGWFKAHPTGRVYIQLDKPLFQPGETIWLKVSLLETKTLAPFTGAVGYDCRLLDPRGATVVRKRVQMKEGAGECDIIVPEGVAGGEYMLKVECIGGPTEERPVIVSAYEPPMIKKKLRVLGKAYGPGDRVEAKAEFRKGTGEALAGKRIVGIVQVDGREVMRLDLRTDEEGGLLAAFDLPDRIETENALLTLKVEEGGITESISRSIPLLLAKLNVDFFPEGGDLVVGLPSRVYFQALKPNGKPAEAAGVVCDDTGAEVVRLSSYHHGMGRFEIRPAPGRRYMLKVTRPANIDRVFHLPAAKARGVVLRAEDDYTGQRSRLRLTLHSTEPIKDVVVIASLRESVQAVQLVDLAAGANEVVLRPEGGQGVMRLTVLGEGFVPLCERLLYREQGADLRVEIRADKDHYMPREAVTLSVRTSLPSGRPVPADLCLSVVDDRVLMYADDKTAHILTHLYLEKDLPGKIEEPNVYFDPQEEKAPLALELLMGTRGWRRFEWKQLAEDEKGRDVRVADQILHDVLTSYSVALGAEGEEKETPDVPMRVGLRRVVPMALAKMAQVVEAGAVPAVPDEAPPAVAPAPADEKAEAREEEPRPAAAAKPVIVPRRPAARKAREPQEPPALARFVGDLEDALWAGKEFRAPRSWAVVRQFPDVTYKTTETEVRHDFRETICWRPRVVTDEHGRAEVSFFLSDAVTSFRVRAEGTAAKGLPGRGELVVDSRTPMHIEAKMPVVLSAGDVVELPLRVSNETGGPLRLSGGSVLPDALKPLSTENVLESMSLAAGEARSFYLPLEAQAGRFDGAIELWTKSAGLTDTIRRRIRVEPVGFPFKESISDTLSDTRSVRVSLPAGIVEGSLRGSVKLYPSPMATMLDGLASILREPCGCFEQTSSSTYPNIMVLNYLRGTEANEPEAEKRALELIKKGYQRLVGFECKKEGYEWFGGDPGHEALTAYGILEFVDMAKVYDGVDQEMIKRTVRWILARRDGKGGFERNERALDSFGRGTPEVTNAYIVWALSEAGVDEIGPEADAVLKSAYGSRNPYVVSLAALATLNRDPKAGDAQELLAILDGCRREDGSYKGEGRSITGSSGGQMDIEATSLAILAQLRAGRPAAVLSDSVRWLLAQRAGGGFGCTQSTILALKALTEYAEASRVVQAAGDVVVRVNGNVAARRHFSKGEQGIIEVGDMEALLRPGVNDIDLQLDSSVDLPFTVDVEYKTSTPSTDEACPVRLTSAFDKADVGMGETVALSLELLNSGKEGQGMTLVRVGIPAGLAPQLWQLKELREDGVFDFYETTPREVILYYRSLGPGAARRLKLDLRADIPGRYTGIASCAYLYYNPRHKWWNAPLQVRVAR